MSFDHPNDAPDAAGDQTVPSTDRYGQPILTVGALRALLAGIDDDLQVVMDDGQGWYVNVGAVVVPAVEPDLREFQCVTLMVGDTFDARQI